MNRALRAATMGVLLLSPVALSACSAGQVTQTATQVRDKSGGQAQVGAISIREAKLAAPSGSDGYERGDDADLQVAFVNGGSGIEWAPDIPIWLSLVVIVGTLVVTTAASLLVEGRTDRV